MKCCWARRKAAELERTGSEREKFTPLIDMSARNISSASPLAYEKQMLHCLKHDSHEGAVVYCTVDPREKILATCSRDKINLWTIATGELLRTLSGHSAEVTSCSFCSFGSILASSSRDKKVILWNYEKGKRASRLELHSDAVLCCAFSKDGKFLASASRDKTARLYKIRPGAGEFVPGSDVKQLTGHTAAVNVVTFSPDGEIALTGADDTSIRAWSKKNDWGCVCKLTEVDGLLKGVSVKSVVFSPVDPAVFVSLAGNRVTVWSMHGYTFKAKNSVDIRSDKELKVISFIPDGGYIVGGAKDGTFNIWNVEDHGWTTWPTTRTSQHEGPILSCCFAGKNFISADETGLTYISELVPKI